MPDLPALPAIDEFQPLLGETFGLRLDAQAEMPLRLSEVRSLGFNTSQDRGGRESFALLYHAPGGARLPQRIYALSHPRLGTREIFLVPIGPDAQGMRLEAIFNFT